MIWDITDLTNLGLDCHVDMTKFDVDIENSNLSDTKSRDHKDNQLEQSPFPFFPHWSVFSSHLKASKYSHCFGQSPTFLCHLHWNTYDNQKYSQVNISIQAIAIPTTNYTWVMSQVFAAPWSCTLVQDTIFDSSTHEDPVGCSKIKYFIFWKL